MPSMFATNFVTAWFRPLALLLAALCFVPTPSNAHSGDKNGTPATTSVPSASEPSTTADSFADPATTSQAEIARLIEGLASNSYATRIRCRDRLMRIGLAAFDQLRAARNHPDNEVAVVATRLTSGLRVQWSVPSDSAAAKELLTEYGSHNLIERRQRIDQLAKLPQRDAFSPLLRLARFETDPVLARTAALALIGLDTREAAQLDSHTAGSPEPGPASGDDAHQGQREAAQIEAILQDQIRISDQWLWQFAADLRANRLHPQAWSKLIKRNREHLTAEQADAASESEVSATELLQLVWTIAERALKHGQETEAIEIVTGNVDLIPAKTRSLIETAAWALNHSLYPAVAAMYDAHPSLYHKSPILLYSAAESFTHLGRDSEATALVEVALEINPLPRPRQTSDDDAAPGNPNQAPPMHPQTLENHADAHLMIAVQLAERGLFQWAEKEYELVIAGLPIDSPYSSFARQQLASMFGDLLRYADAVATLTPLAQRINQDDEFRNRLSARRFRYAVVQSDLDYYRALLMIEKGEQDAAKPVLRDAFQMYQDNIDILIAMYRLDGDQEWKAEVAKTLREQVQLASNRITEQRNSLQRAGPFRHPDRDLAKALNAYAWLVSNTEGDTAQALRFSQESLRLVPDNGAMMDTCARCYFATGDLEAAVAMQVQACEKMPHSPPLQRQLKEFREALRQSKHKPDQAD